MSTFGWHLFGETCSLYSLQQILHTHLSDNTKGQEFVNKFYVDNYMHTYDDEQILISNKVILKELTSVAYIPLQGWISNDQQFNEMYVSDKECFCASLVSTHTPYKEL